MQVFILREKTLTYAHKVYIYSRGPLYKQS